PARSETGSPSDAWGGRDAATATTSTSAGPPEPGGARAVPGGVTSPDSSPAGGLPLPAKPKIGDTRPAPPAPPVLPRAARSRPAVRGLSPGPDTAGTAGTADHPAAEGDATPRRRRRRGGRARAGTGDSRPIEAFRDDPMAEPDDDALDRRRGRERKGRPVGRYLMIVSVRPHATQIAVLEGRSLIEQYVSRPSDDVLQIDGNIYLGRVQNVLPGMEAAFVDIGTPKNAVLYRGDVRYDKDEVDGEPAGAGEGSGPTRGRSNGPGREARIEQLLKDGQNIVCQVTKNPIGTKGARLTQEVSLPGRFVVLIPNSDTYGISKRLTDDERKRLRRILDDIRPPGHGLIVRTAAEGATADELRRDVARLMHQWGQIDALAKRSRAPALLYREPDMAVRVIREEFNKDYRGVVIDDEALYTEVRDYVASISPELADRVEFAGDSDNPLPVFERFHVHEQVHKALDRKVWLPSGGSLIIERTEALTVIDVNTGKNVGVSNLEETVYRNNLEAAEEIARQLRLRDIGGIIVIDFIDMEIAANRADVIRTFREALARDKTRTQVFDISELGLVEMTRKRISEGLVESFSQTCPMCAGRGIIIDESLL
ncbi:MAG TPA: Rne/Rng family ribonuclease, partial [Acidimicrobiales bacterium]|nr:Rne/Rng family ribonuclease [Acidimicrobiales bacterium]